MEDQVKIYQLNLSVLSDDFLTRKKSLFVFEKLLPNKDKKYFMQELNN